jgi:hypothetical protein
MGIKLWLPQKWYSCSPQLQNVTNSHCHPQWLYNLANFNIGTLACHFQHNKTNWSASCKWENKEVRAQFS